jgi:hypothetical protein
LKVGDALIWLGIGLAAVGVLVRFGLFSWFGHLPGDIRPAGKGGGLYFPITSSLVISLAATVIINLILRLFGQR